MAGLVAAPRVWDLTPVAPGVEGAEGDPRPLFTWEPNGGQSNGYRVLGSSLPSDGGAPRLIVDIDEGYIGVWDTGTGALLHELMPGGCTSLVTYHRQPDGRPRVAAGTTLGQVLIYDGDDFRLVGTISEEGLGEHIFRVITYEEPTSGRTRLVTA
jgi:WD40 repeat protein